MVGVEAGARAQQAGGQSETPPSEPVIAGGVTVSGIAVGGRTAGEAERALSSLLAPPVTVTFRNQSWRYVPETLGATPQVASAVEEALNAPRTRHFASASKSTEPSSTAGRARSQKGSTVRRGTPRSCCAGIDPW